MTDAVFDFKSIRRSLEKQAQKVEFEEKNPKPEPNKVVWHPQYGYGPVPLYAAAIAQADLQGVPLQGILEEACIWGVRI